VEFAETMPLIAGAAPKVEVSSGAGMLEIEVGESPTYIVVNRTAGSQ
jgi:hypothetical protein